MGRIVHGDLFRRLVQATDFMEACHAQPIELGDIAARAALSPYHFLRLFRRTFGVTPHEYLTRVRLARARDLLARRGASVTETCLEVGYASLGSFSTLFARRFGVSPVAYQRRVRRLVPVAGEVGRIYIPCCFLALLGRRESNGNSREAAAARR